MFFARWVENREIYIGPVSQAAGTKIRPKPNALTHLPSLLKLKETAAGYPTTNPYGDLCQTCQKAVDI